MPTWLKQELVKNRRQPRTSAPNRAPPHRNLGWWNSKKNHFPVSKKNISIAIFVCLEQGNLLSQRAPFFFFGLQHSANGPHHERAVDCVCHLKDCF
jgi:hypothetical protein